MTGEKPFVLVVDDEELVSEVIEAHVANSGYAEKSIHDPQEAIGYFEENHETIDVAIIDLTLPGISGIELAEKFLETKPDLCAILVTGQVAEGIPSDKKSLFHSIIYKPFQRADVVGAIETTLGIVCGTARAS